MRNRSRGYLRLACFILPLAIAISYVWLNEPQASVTPTRGDIVRVSTDPAPKGHKVEYAYSVVPGGVQDKREVAAAIVRDSLVRDHYKRIQPDKLQNVSSRSRKELYVSYRKAGNIYWTSKPVAIPAGEKILTDGSSTIRARCGNLLSSTPQQPVNPVRSEEPSSSDLDQTIGEPRAVALGNPGGQAGASPTGGARSSSGVMPSPSARSNSQFPTLGLIVSGPFGIAELILDPKPQQPPFAGGIIDGAPPLEYDSGAIFFPPSLIDPVPGMTTVPPPFNPVQPQPEIPAVIVIPPPTQTGSGRPTTPAGGSTGSPPGIAPESIIYPEEETVGGGNPIIITPLPVGPKPNTPPEIDVPETGTFGLALIGASTLMARLVARRRRA